VSKLKLLKSATSVGLVTTCSRVFGYVRDASLAWVLGAGFGMDAFTVAYRLANLFRRLVGEGAMSAAFVPVFVEYKTKNSAQELWDFTRKFFYTLALVTAAMVILEIVFAPVFVRIMAPGFIHIKNKFELCVLLTRMMAPYLALVSLAALLTGILNSFGKFIVPAFNPVYFNVSVILSALVAARFFPQPAVAVSLGVLLGGVLQVLMQIAAAKKVGMNFKIGFSFKHPMIRRVGFLLLPSIFGIGIVQINLLVDSLMASFLREGSVSQLYYADRVMELVLGIFTISLATVILPDMARSAAAKNMQELKKTLTFSLRVMAFVAIPATVGLFLMSSEIVKVLFERGRFTAIDTDRTAVALCYYALGLFFISAVRLIVQAFYSLQDTKTPVKVGAISLLLNIVLNWALMHPLKQGGIALATSIAAAVSVIQLLYIFQKRYGLLDWKKLNESFLKILISAGVMGLSCLTILRLIQFDSHTALSWKIGGLFGTIAAGALIYCVVAFILKAEDGIIFSRLWPKMGKSGRNPEV